MSEAGSRTGSGWSRRAESSDHVAAAAPIAPASVRIEAIAGPGCFTIRRSANRNSSSK